MKKKLFLLLALSAVLPASALEQREFHNADKSKSFTGEAIAYNAKTETVTVLREGGGELTFKLSLLSEDDQAYIQKHSVKLATAGSVRIEMKEYEEERQKTRTDDMRSAITPTGFAVTVINDGDSPLHKVEVDYTIYFLKDSEDGDGRITEKTGTLNLYSIYPGNSYTDRSGTVSLERYSRSTTGGG